MLYVIAALIKLRLVDICGIAVLFKYLTCNFFSYFAAFKKYVKCVKLIFLIIKIIQYFLMYAAQV